MWLRILLISFMLVMPSFALQKVRVILDWVQNPNHAPLLYAKAMGYFKDQGLDVQFIVPSGSTDGSKVVAFGKAEVAITYQPTFLSQLSHGLSLVRFDTLVDHPLESVLVLDSGPKSLKAFVGKTVGTSSVGGKHVIFKTMLQYNHVSMKQVHFISTSYSLVQALLSHSVDSIIGAMRNYEPLEIVKAGKKFRQFYPEKNGVPSYDELILVTSVKNQHKPWLKAFVKAHRKAMIDMDKNPKKVWNVVIKNHPNLNTKLNRKSFMLTLVYFDQHPNNFSPKRYAAFQKYLENQKVIATGLQVNKYAINPLK